MPSPIPTHTPCARKKCQYFVPRLVMNVPKTTRNDPTAMVVRMYLASARRPDNVQIP